MSSIFFIDARVALIDSLLKGIAKDTRADMLDMSRDGVEQIAAALDGISKRDAAPASLLRAPYPQTLGVLCKRRDVWSSRA